MRIAPVALLALFVLAPGCGGGSKPAETVKTETAETTTKTSTDKPAGKDAPKVTYKYPEPYLEPECAEPQPEGYLPDAKKAVAEVRKKHWDDLEKCAEEAPPGENVSGEIRTTFRLDPDGIPRCVEAPGAPPSMHGVVNCVVAMYRNFRFPKPKNGSVRISDGIHLHVSHEEE
jgi:hypothetical protein